MSMIVDGHEYSVTKADDNTTVLLNSAGLAIAQVTVEHEQAMFELLENHITIFESDSSWSCHENTIIFLDLALARFYAAATS